MANRDAAVGYVAGLFDGEGCVATRKPRGPLEGWTVWAIVAMSDPRPLQRIAAIFGGKVAHKKSAQGCKPQWKWEVRSSVALAFYTAITPHLTAKREEAELAMDLLRATPRYRTPIVCANNERRRSLGLAIRALKRESPSVEWPT